MDCPSCKYPDMHVIRSNYDKSEHVERRRECLKCGMRITTEEHIKPAKKKPKSYVQVT